jgi:hypothetical protein
MELLIYRANPADLVELLVPAERRAASIALRKAERPASDATRICLVTSTGIAIRETLGDLWSVDDDIEYLVAVAISRSGGSVTATQKRFVFDPIVALEPPLPIAELSSQIDRSSSKARFDSDWRGRLPPKTSDDVWSALLNLSGTEKEALQELARALTLPIALASSSLEVLEQERDAVAMAIEVFDPPGRSPRRLLRNPSMESTDAPFLSRLTSSHQLEDQVISADGRHFMKWLASETAHAAAISFQSGPRHLTIVNANKAGLERATGADLIYYNHGTKSFVFVQYKMLERNSREWVYYPDPQFGKELERLIKVEKKAAASVFDEADHLSYRIGPPVTYFKFCRRDARFDPTDASMLKGFYVPVPYVSPLMASLTVPGKGPRLTNWGLRPRSLNSASFARLVSSGLVGTRGSTTAEVVDAVRASLELGRSVVAAFEEVDADWEPPEQVRMPTLDDIL